MIERRIELQREVKVRVRNGDVEVSKRDLGVAHIPGSLWSWAPDGAEVGMESYIEARYLYRHIQHLKINL